MSESEARKRLRHLLRTYTAGSILHLLGDELATLAKKARQKNEVQRAEQLKNVAATLFVVGLGVDAANPGEPV